MELKYWGRTFTSPEEVGAYGTELWKKYQATDYKDEKISKERNDFSEAVGNYILDLLRTLTIDLDKNKFDENTATDKEYKEFINKRYQLQNEIIELGNIIDFWYEWRYDEHVNKYDLEKSYACMTYYYRDYKDKSIFFALDCCDSPYQSWYNDGYSFYATKRKPYVAYTYLAYDDEEVKNL